MNRVIILALVFIILLLPTINSAMVEFNTSIYHSIPDSLVYSTAAYYNNEIFLIGGLSITNSISDSVYIYSNGNWYLGPSLPFPLMSAGATVCDGKLYVVGGDNSTSIFGGILEYTGNGWKIVSNSMPIPVYGAIVFSYNNEIYVIGGMNYSGNQLESPVSYIQVYNVQSGTWQIIGDAPIPLYYSAYYFNGTALIVAGGFINAAEESPYVYVYYPQNNTWISLPSLPGIEAGGALGYFNGYIYLIGGLYVESGNYNGGEILYYHNGTWRNSGVNEPQPTMFSAYLQLSNTLIILGGYGPGNVPSNAFQIINILTPPSEPQIASIVSGNETITVKWYDTNTTGYYLAYWSNLSQRITINVGNVSSYTLKGLKDGVTYYIQIIPYNEYGNGTPSDIVSATPYSVPNPPMLNVHIGNKNATLSWIDTFNGGYPILGYYLYLDGKLINIGNITTYTLTNLIPGKLYTVGIIAYNQIGNSSLAEKSFIAEAKANLTVTISKEINGFLVSWNSSYKATYILTVYNNNQIIFNKSTTNTSLFVKAPFGVYNITLKAINLAGITSYSFTLIYYIQPSPPEINWTIYLNTISLTWNKSIGAKYYLIYDNDHLVANTTSTSFTFNLTFGDNDIEIFAANPYYESAPSVVKDVVNHIVVENTTVFLLEVPKVTETQVISTDFPQPSSNIDLKSAIIVIVVFVLALLMILAITREKEH